MGILKRLIEMFDPYREEYRISREGKILSVERNARTGERVATYNGIVYSRIPKENVLTGSYWDLFLPLGFVDERERILMIGLGGGTVAYQMESVLKGRVELEIVESDRDMLAIARKLYPEMRSRVTIEDGARFVGKTRGRYDAIILDAYTNLDIPKGFLSDGFCRGAFDAMKDNGIMCVNYAHRLTREDEMVDYARRLSRLFKVYLMEVGGMSNNTILLCSKSLSKAEIVDRLAGRMKGYDGLLSKYREMKPCE